MALLSISILALPLLLAGELSVAVSLEAERIITEISRGGLADSARLTELAEHYEENWVEDPARLAREAEIARLRGLAGPGAGSWAGFDEGVHLRGLVEAAASSDVVSRSREAEIARLRGLAGPGAGSWARVDESVHLRHLRGLAEAALSSRGESDCACLPHYGVPGGVRAPDSPA